MLFFLIRILRDGRARGWLLPVVVVGVVFVTSWPLMVLAEGAGADLVAPNNYWWWFLITSSTVGYGDLYPTTTLGHVAGAYVVLGGIATLTTLITRIAAAIETVRGRRMRGAVTVTTAGHVVILGYAPGRTEHIIDELLAENDQRVVLATGEDVVSHPMQDRQVEFVRGDLSSEALLRRASVPAAAVVLIDARDDNESLAIALTVNHVAADTHTVIALRDMARATQVGYINPGTLTVPWHSPRVIAEELQSPGISRVYAELMTHGGQNTYSLRLPSVKGATSFGELQTALGREFQATVLAADTGGGLLVSPSWDLSVPDGSVLYYVCRQQIPPDHLARAIARQRPR